MSRICVCFILLIQSKVSLKGGCTAYKNGNKDLEVGSEEALACQKDLAIWVFLCDTKLPIPSSYANM